MGYNRAKPITRPGQLSSDAAERPLSGSREGRETDETTTAEWLHFLSANTIHPKLNVSMPGDADERQADAVADQVMRMTGPGSSSEDVGQIERRTTASADSDKTVVARKADGANASRAQGQQGIAALGDLGAGIALPPAERAFFEPRLGRDLSHVRVHDDDAGGHAARSIRARAFTVGSDIGFAEGEYRPGTQSGRNLIAHEIAHVIQNDAAAETSPMIIRRVPAAPHNTADDRIPADRSKVDLAPIPDVDLSPTGKGQIAATVTMHDSAIVHMRWELFDAGDTLVASQSTLPTSPPATTGSFTMDTAALKTSNIKGRCLLRCTALDANHEPVSYADRQFWAWDTTPTGTAPDIVVLEQKKIALDKLVAKGSGKSFGEVGKAFTELKDVQHDLGVLKTGTGTHVGNQCAVQPSGAVATDCTNIVLEVLENTFAQQGKAADWAKIRKTMTKNIKLGGRTKMSGIDLQAALQSEAGWKGVYWAPDPTYQVPKAELEGANSDEASYTSTIASKKKTYYKNKPKKGYPGVTVDHKVTDYAPEAPNTGFGTASTTTKTTTQLDKLKKLNFGVLAAHGGYHMTLIMNGRVMEVHWSLEATNVDLIEETDLESWAVGPKSGFHYYASGVIVAPPADVDAAFK